MNIKTLQRLGGITLIIGSFFLTVWTIVWSTMLPIAERMHDYTKLVSDPDWIWIAVISFIGIIFMIFGFTATYSRISDRTGITGLAGYVFVILAYLFQAAKVTWEIFIFPFLIENPATTFSIKDKILFLDPNVKVFRILSQLTILIGVVLFCIALIRSKEFPKSAGALILIGAILYGIGPMIQIYVAIAGVLILSTGCLIVGKTMYGSHQD